MKICQRAQTSDIKKQLNMFSRQLKTNQNLRINFIQQNPNTLLSTKNLIKKVASKNLLKYLRSHNTNQENNKKQATVEDLFKKVQLTKQKQEQIRTKKKSQNNFYEKLHRTLAQKLKKTKNHSTQQAKQQMKLMQKCRNNKHMRKNSMSCSFQKYFSGRTSNAQSINFSDLRVSKQNKLLIKDCCLSRSKTFNHTNQFYDRSNTQQYISSIQNATKSVNNLKQNKIPRRNTNYFYHQRHKKNDTKYLNKKYFQNQKKFRVKINQLMQKCEKQNEDDNGVRKNLDAFKFFCDKVDKRLQTVENIFIKKFISI